MIDQRSDQKIVIYQTEGGETQIDVRLEQETVWLTQVQVAELFDRERSVITKHIKNVFTEGELDEKSNVQNLHIANSDKSVKLYNLDVIISVGYRVKSKRGTQFRIWANNILKQYLVQGYALNERKLQAEQDKLLELRRAIILSSRLLHKKGLTRQESQSILIVLENYSHALTVLDDYDHQRLLIVGTPSTRQPRIEYGEAI
jgi:prophage maintenance system killer protein